jgi:nucleoside-diphosphate-sugar epimerase
MDKPKILITGGCGFIFSYVTEYFVKKGWEVVVIDDLSKGSHPEIIDGSFKFHNLDCANLAVQEIIIEENPDYIVHASAISDVDFSIKEPQYTLYQNILSTINVFEAARFVPNLKKFLYVSTDEVYGECEEQKNESDIIFPKNPYSASKAVGSLLRLAYDNTYHNIKDKTCETRFCNVMGMRQDNRKVLSRIVQSFKDGSPMPIQNGGSGKREYIYVKNIPPVIDLLLQKGDRVYNVTTNDLLSVNDLIEKMEKIVGRKLTKTEAHRPGMDKIYQMDSSRIRELGWKPLYTLDEGLEEYLRLEGVI